MELCVLLYLLTVAPNGLVGGHVVCLGNETRPVVTKRSVHTQKVSAITPAPGMNWKCMDQADAGKSAIGLAVTVVPTQQTPISSQLYRGVLGAGKSDHA